MFKEKLKFVVVGFLIGVLLVGSIGFAASTGTLYDVLTGGIRIVVDGKQLNPTDANGNRVEPFIYNGTTYLPVRAVANAMGKAVYWDGPEYTVYLGEMDGKLEYPTVGITDVDNLGHSYDIARAENLKDNYGNFYSSAISRYGSGTFETILNMKYSRFRCTIYTPKGNTYDREPTKILIKADGKTIYSSPELTKTSRPVNVDIDIRGCNVFEIETIGHGDHNGYIGDAGFYQ